MKKLTIGIAAGGTAGHINPALALAEELRERGHRVFFVGQEAKLEGKLVPEAGFELNPIVVSGLDRSRPLTAIKAFMQMRKAQREMDKLIEKKRPDAVIGFGAYVEIPLLMSAHEHNVPIVIHEQNSVAGLANKALAPHAQVIAVAFEEARDEFARRKGRNTHILRTGNPVRKEFSTIKKTDAKKALDIPKNASTVLIFGGSLGAESLNNAVVKLKDKLLKNTHRYIIHATGHDHFDHVVKQLDLTAPEQKRYRVYPYIEEMGNALAAANVVISRAGASSIAEIIASKTPALLIPYPHATHAHQDTNAALLLDAGCAIKLADQDLEAPIFEKTVMNLLDNKGELQKLEKAFERVGNVSATELLADTVEKVAYPA